MTLRAADILNAFDDRQLRKLIGARKIQSKIENLAEEIRHFHAQAEERLQQKKALEKKLDRILKGARPVSRAGRRGPTLPDAILSLLSSTKKPLGLTDLTKAILDRGYKTASAFPNFRTTVAHSLSRLKSQLARKGDGYMLRNGRKPAKKAVKERKKTDEKAVAQAAATE